MQVRWFHSLKFKLFMLMGIFLLMVAAAVSGKNIFDFQRILKDQLSEKLVGIAESSLASIENQAQTWRSQANQSLRIVATKNAKLISESVKSVVENDSNILSFHIIRKSEKGKLSSIGYAFTGNKVASDFMGKNPKSVKKKLYESELKWARKTKRLPKRSIIIENISKVVGIPVIRIWIPAITGKKAVNWAVLSVLQKGLVSILPNDKDTSSALLDSRGRVLMSAKITEVFSKRNYSTLRMVKKAIAGKSIVGSQEFKSSENQTMIGTFAYSKNLNTTVFVKRDPRLAYNEIKRQIANTALLSFIFLLLALLASYHAAKGITKSLNSLVEGTQQIAQGHFNSRLQPKTKDEVAIVSHAVNFMSSRIEDLMASQVEAARQEKELETAKTVQETLLPKSDRTVGPVSVSGAYFPASECGGDWWGNFTTSDGLEFVCVADATGHGAAAALVTAMAFSGCMTMAKMQNETGQADGPDKILSRLNDIMCSAGNGKITMTFFAAFINPITGEMVYSNAGHNFPFLIPSNIEDDRLRKLRKKKKGGRGLPLLLGGTPLGFEPTSNYRTKKIQLQPGDKLFLYTDGLIECTNSEKTMWGRNNLLNTIADSSDGTHVNLKEVAIERAFSFFDGFPADDDVTVVVVEMDKNWVPQTSTKVA